MNRNIYIKKSLYVSLFVLLGAVFQAGIHAVLESAYIQLLIGNYPVFSLGLSWQTWFTVHSWFTAFFLIVGLSGGLWQGFYWWPKLYDPLTGKRRMNSGFGNQGKS